MARGRPTSGTRRSEFLGLFAFALAVLVTVALLSFDPLDRSWFSAPSALRGPTRNLIGAFGANLAYGLYVAFGLPAWAIPVTLVLAGIAWLRGKAERPRVGRIAGAALLWLTISALLAVTVQDVRFRGADAGIVRIVPIPAGGVLGTAFASVLGRWLNEAGSLIVLLTLLASGLLLTTPVSYARLLDRTLAGFARTRASLAAAWARHLERRRRAGERDKAAARERAAAEKEERQRQEVEARRAEAEAKKVAAEAKAREKVERERTRVEQERARVEAERTRSAEESARKEREIAEIAARAALARRPEAATTAASAPVIAAASGRAAEAAKLAPAAEAALRARQGAPAAPESRFGPAAPAPALAAALAPDPAAAAESAIQATAAIAAARAASETARRAAAVTVRLDPAQQEAEARKSVAGREPRPAAAVVRDGGAPALTALNTPRDVAALAAEASDAVRKAREAKAEAEARKKPGRAAEARADFALPPMSLLQTVKNDAVVTERELVENAKVLVSKLKEFDVEGTVQAIHPGPVVTTYEYRPEAGVKYSKIVGLADDLCLAMKAEGVRIDRISGKSAVGIEVPNSAREIISLKEILETDEFVKSSSRLTFALGKAIEGETYVTDLRKMPHLLVAGATGSGKSVAVNCMIVSVLYKASPEEVRFIMVDPKRIELGVYDGIPHLLVPVVTDCRLASNALRWAVVEMENRYKRLASTGVRSLEQYNQYLRGPEARKLAETHPPEELQPLPYIVIIIDELADLMMVAGNDVEDSVSRLAAMARAVGIHLVLATQRPSVDVITGVIKANFPSRIAFRVSSKVDSRTILDSNGAEMLLGKGDMLFMPPGSARLQRVHGAFISDGEVQRLVNYLKNQREPEYREDVLKAAEPESQEMEGGDMDEMYDDAVRVVLETGQASVSHLQRRLRLGYGRAARLVDMMELNGLVGPSQGAKGREILVDRASYLAQMGEAR